MPDLWLTIRGETVNNKIVIRKDPNKHSLKWVARGKDKYGDSVLIFTSTFPKMIQSLDVALSAREFERIMQGVELGAVDE